MAAPAKEPTHCPSCGQALGPEGPHRMVGRRVRASQIFGGKRSGELVQVCEHVLEHRSTQLGTCTVEEHEASLQPKPVVPEGPTSVDRARDFSKRIAEDYERDREARAATAQREVERAEHEAAEAAKHAEDTKKAKR